MSRRPTRRLGAAGVAALVVAASTFTLLAIPSFAQEGAPEPLADVPSGPATLRGRVIHDERPEANAGVEVVLYALGPEGQPGEDP